MSKQNLVRFDSWEQVLDAARRGVQLWYEAPLDYHARAIRVVRVHKNGKMRIDPLSNQADQFTADAGHVYRFRMAPEQRDRAHRFALSTRPGYEHTCSAEPGCNGLEFDEEHTGSEGIETPAGETIREPSDTK